MQALACCIQYYMPGCCITNHALPCAEVELYLSLSLVCCYVSLIRSLQLDSNSPLHIAVNKCTSEIVKALLGEICEMSNGVKTSLLTAKNKVSA